VGGIFTPTLFLGAALGGLFADLLHHLQLAGDLPATAFALVGMGSLLAATTHSPLLAMILVIEISPNYSLMPPLMIACAVATLAARRLYREDVYTAPIRRRGIALDRDNARLGVITQKTIGDLMQVPVPPVKPTSPFRELADRFLTSPLNHLPVTDPSGRLIGLVALQDLKEHLGSGSSLDSVIAFDVMRPPPACVTPDQRLVDALPILLSSDMRNVPVVNSITEMKLIGVVIRPEALGLVAEMLDVHSAQGG
jgi:CIC family chloride channel protein